MKRFLLCVPVLLIGLPLLGCLILARSRAIDLTDDTGDAASKAPPVVVVKKGELPDNAKMETLAKDDPIAFLEYCLAKDDKIVKTGYSLTLYKKEVITDIKHPAELIEVHFRRRPFSVFFKWIEGGRKAERVMYVEGENKDAKGKSQLLARPSGAFARRIVGDVVEREVSGTEAKQSGRYTLAQFGFAHSTERTLAGWKKGLAGESLRIEYLGIEKVKELNDRPCFVFRATNSKPNDDNVTEFTGYFDTEWWFQSGSILKDKDGKVIGEYYFRDIKLNPEFKPGQFERSAMK